MAITRLYMLSLFLPIFLLMGVNDLTFAEGPGTEPIHIEADRMESNPQKDVIVFSGNVRAEQGDVILTAEKMTVNYFAAETGQKEPQGLANKIKNILAQGNVEIIKGDLVATGNNMTYFSVERKVSISGNATAWQAQNRVSGENITLYLEEGRSVVEGSGEDGQRVKAYIYTDGTAGSEPLSTKPK
jgi:lipopolysaccharide export system protein LptA